MRSEIHLRSKIQLNRIHFFKKQNQINGEKYTKQPTHTLNLEILLAMHHD